MGGDGQQGERRKPLTSGHQKSALVAFGLFLAKPLTFFHQKLPPQPFLRRGSPPLYLVELCLFGCVAVNC